VGKPVKRIATILARGGSKGLPGKNVRPLAGKPLVAHTIEQARESRLFDAIAVSSDDEAVLNIARSFDVKHVIRRPDSMATDVASKLPPIIHCAREAEAQLGIEFDLIVDLDVTSPLRTAADIRGAVELLEHTGAANVITGAVARKSPYFNLVEQRPDGTVVLSKPTTPRIERRQEAPVCFDMNAAVYVWRRNMFFKTPDVFYPTTALYEMPDERSYDIDTLFDFEFVEFLMTRRNRKSQGVDNAGPSKR
jgi:CMP-N-acetylneuraminic acid synthetase